nr:MAG TPA_asm: hypothetical protein [Caudoviricetes sp.]
MPCCSLLSSSLVQCFELFIQYHYFYRVSIEKFNYFYFLRFKY